VRFTLAAHARPGSALERAPAPSAGRLVKGLAALAALGLALSLANSALGLPSVGPVIAAGDVEVIVLTAAAAICLGRAAHMEVERAAWALFALALALWACGKASEGLIDGPQRGVSPSVADALYLSMYPALYAGAALLVRSRVADVGRMLWLDGLLAALTLAAAAEALLGPVVERPLHDGALAVAVVLAYPLADLVLLGFTVSVLAVKRWQPGRALGLVTAGLGVLFLADAASSYGIAAGGWSEATLTRSAWLLAACLLAAAAWQPTTERRTLRAESGTALAVPGVLALAATAVLVYAGFAAPPAQVPALASAALVVAVLRLVVTVRDSHRLASRARTDPLTGVFNQGEFHAEVERQIHFAGQRAGHVSIVLLDLDEFKAINDTHGHSHGDRVLRAVAAGLRAGSRASDGAYRVGGDEFALVLPEADGDEAAEVARRAVTAARAGLGDEQVGISHGIAVWPRDGLDKETLLLKADIALYAAKNGTREGAASAAALIGAPPEAAAAIASQRELERAQLLAYAEDFRETHARELRRTQELHQSYLATVRALAVAVEAKDGYTGGHIHRVHALGLLLAQALVPDDVDDPQLAYGFLLHDVGKLAVPDAVLMKPGKLTDEEWELMRRHSEAGLRILSEIPFLDRALDVVVHHHERWDGGGYPRGLRGEEIPLWARIFAVVDSVDAMTSDRPYRAGMPLDDALEELRRGAGSQFDPACVAAFAALDVARIEALLESRTGEEDARRGHG